MENDKINDVAEDAIQAYDAIAALLGHDQILMDAVKFYASLFARFQMERIYSGLHVTNQFGAARAAREQIEALIALDLERTKQANGG